MRDEVERLRDQYQFLHWHLAFPDVFQVKNGESEYESLDKDKEGIDPSWHGGFDVVLGNPPWDRIKFQEKEWFSTKRPDISITTNSSTRRKMIQALKNDDLELFKFYCEAKRKSEGESHFTRNSQRFPLCGRGDVNTYTVFTENNLSVINIFGKVGCIVPSGIATDDTSKLFFQHLMKTETLHQLFSFFEIRRLFPGTDSRNPFCLLTLGGSSNVSPNGGLFMFSLRKAEDIRDKERQFFLQSKDIEILNPNTLTCPAFSFSTDAELSKKIYYRVPVLLNERIQIEDSWELKIRRILDMGDPEIIGKCISNEGKRVQGFLPVYEAKMTDQFDYRSASYLGSKIADVTLQDKKTATFQVLPRYWIPQSIVLEKNPDEWNRKWFFCWRDIVNSERTTNACILPFFGTDFTLRVGFPSQEVERTAIALVSVLNSFVLDYCTRQKVGGLHLSDYITKQLPVPPPSLFSSKVNWISAQSFYDWVFPRALELSYTAWDLQPFAQDCGYEGPPFKWDEDRRFLLRCELDAAYFHLYGIQRDDVDYIMDTFPIVKRKDEKAHGHYRTKNTILQIYDAMATAIASGQPYQTILDPPPADPRVAHPPKAS